MAERGQSYIDETATCFHPLEPHSHTQHRIGLIQTIIIVCYMQLDGFLYTNTDSFSCISEII